MNASAIDQLFARAVAEGVMPGVVAAVGDRDECRYEGAFGTLSVDDPTAVRPDTMFHIASMTKAIVSIAALALVERGELALDQRVADVVPAFGELQVLEGFDGDEPRLRPPARQATVHELLTHTSGLGYWFANADLLRYHQVTGLPDPLSGRAAMFDAPLVADPGTRWEYSTSIDWLGRVIEAVAGVDLADHLDEHVFTPLGMADSTFRLSDEQEARRMATHDRTGDGGLAVSAIEIPRDPEFASGGGGMAATAGDYLRFMRALLRGGELDGQRIVNPETVDLAFGDRLGGLQLPGEMPSALPELTNDVPALPFAQGWGYGFHLVLEDIPGMRRAGTGDWAGLPNCYYWIDRASGVAALFLTQVLPFFDERIVEVGAGFETAVYAEIAAPAPA